MFMDDSFLGQRMCARGAWRTLGGEVKDVQARGREPRLASGNVLRGSRGAPGATSAWGVAALGARAHQSSHCRMSPISPFHVNYTCHFGMLELLPCCHCFQDAPDLNGETMILPAEHEEWRTGRRNSLANPEGGVVSWIGLWELPQGSTWFGSDPTLAIVLPAEDSPPLAGKLDLVGGQVRLFAVRPVHRLEPFHRVLLGGEHQRHVHDSDPLPEDVPAGTRQPV